jgi:virginiamycin B lyase
MRFSRQTLLIAVVLVAIATAPRAQDVSALTGTVSSAQEGVMEGVLVSAKKRNSTITVTVVSDHDGHFAFPASRLPPGHYAIAVRAIGYELDGSTEADVSEETAPIDLHLRSTRDLAAQLTNAEWLASFPGSADDKRPLLECMSCHTLERIARSTHDAQEWVATLERMAGYANNTTQAKPQRRAVDRKLAPERTAKTAAYLASINLSTAPTWSYPLKTLDRPRGRATRVIITEYDLPRATIAPHDVHVDKDGVWYSDFTEPVLGRLDPATGKLRDYPVPIEKPDFPTGALDLEFDQDGNPWLALMFQSGLAKFDRKTEQFQVFPIPSAQQSDTMQQSMVMPRHSDVDGKVWTNDVNHHSVMRLDLASGTFEAIDPFKNIVSEHVHAPYGMMADSENNLYFLDFGDESIGRIDAKTLRVTLYPTPTPYSRPRRGMLDDKDELWFAEFAGDRIGMFDTKREEFREWPVPPYTAPYDVAVDKTGEVWAGSMASDRVLRLDPAQGQFTEYLLPHSTNIRRVFVDDTTSPVTFWAGNNHHAAIVKLEPLN